MRVGRRRGFRGWVGSKVKARVRYWVDGAEIIHWDDPRHRLTFEDPTFAPIRLLDSVSGQGASVHVGKYCGLHYTAVVITGGQHHLDWVSLMHAHDEDGQWVTRHEDVVDRGPVVIGSDVWVGFEAVIMSGVEIGHGAAVAARAVVTKDVEPYSVVAGNPARHVKYRFDESTREALLRIKWWDWPRQVVAAHRDLIHSREVDTFVALHDPALGPPTCSLCPGS